jgi:hypothetical protein
VPNLYNCRHSGDQYRISKFDHHFDLESSYLCTEAECECPAGHRPTCRHRQMIPKFIAREAVNTEWFFDHDRGGWVQGEIEPAPQAPTTPAQETPFTLGGFPDWCIADGHCTTQEDCILNGCAKGHGTPPLPEGIQVFGMDDVLGIHNAIADAVEEPEAKLPSRLPTIRRRV